MSLDGLPDCLLAALHDTFDIISDKVAENVCPVLQKTLTSRARDVSFGALKTAVWLILIWFSNVGHVTQWLRADERSFNVIRHFGELIYNRGEQPARLFLEQNLPAPNNRQLCSRMKLLRATETFEAETNCQVAADQTADAFFAAIEKLNM